MNQPKTEDYLHLYTGGKVVINSGAHKLTDEYGIIAGCSAGKALINYKGEILPIEFVDIKPILRDISGITKSEAIDLIKLKDAKYADSISIRYFNSVCIGWKATIPPSKNYFEAETHFHTLTPHQTAYLLKQGIDLFDLITAGLALKMTTLEKIFL